MQVKVDKQPKATLQLTVTVPASDVKSTYEDVLTEEVKTAEIQGFRKGMAPRKVVEEKYGPSKLYGKVINQLLQKYYTQAIKENHIAPISNPKVTVKEFDLNKDFEFEALVATRPAVKVGDYKAKLKKRYEERIKQATKDLKETNKEKLAKGEKLEEPHVHLGTHDVLEILNEVSQVDVPDLLIDEEVDRMMSKLIDQTQNLGMTIDQYLKAQDKTAEELRKDYGAMAERNIKAEFILGHLVQELKIDVPDEEIKSAFAAAGAENIDERMNNPMEKIYVKSILQKNKLLTTIMEEAEGEKHNDH